MADLFFDEDEEADEAAYAEREPVRGRTGRRLGKVLLVLAVLGVLVLVGLGLAGRWVQRRIDPPGPPGEEVAFTVPEGASASSIADLLADEGIVSDASVFRYYLRINGGGPFEAGEYQLRERSAMGDVVDALESGAALPDAVNATIPEGLWVPQVAESVDAEVERFSAERFLELVDGGTVRSDYQPPGQTSMEGLLFPDTYRVEEDDDEAALLTQMVEALDRTAGELGYLDSAARVGLDPYQTIVVASLIEAEAKVDGDRARISRVIHNRLAEDMTLGIDATVYFALNRRGGSLTTEDLAVESPYNTRVNPGLPPTPIAMPGRASLEAAINPEPGPWLFYVLADEQGNHAFSENIDDFNRDVAAARERGLIP